MLNDTNGQTHHRYALSLYEPCTAAKLQHFVLNNRSVGLPQEPAAESILALLSSVWIGIKLVTAPVNRVS
jgi:hypothetical protein